MYKQFLVTLVAALMLGSIILPQSVSADLFENNSSFSPDAKADSTSLTNAQKETEVSGTLTIFVIDGGVNFEGNNADNNTNNQSQVQLYVVDNFGRYHQLLLSDELKQQMNEFVNLNGHKVTVTGTSNNSDDPGSSSTINVQGIEPIDGNENQIAQNRINNKDFTTESHMPTPSESPSFAEPVIGTQKFVTLLCKFADSTDFTPEPPSYAEKLMNRVDRYYQEVSYGKIDLDGSIVAGWYDMPEPRTSYITEGSSFPIDVAKLIEDCTNAADEDIDFTDYDGINFFFNQNLFGSFNVGTNKSPLLLDGELKFYRATLMSLFGWHNQDVVAHEMGHSFGLPHSSGPYGPYLDSNWDVMSGIYACKNPDEEYRCHGPQTISFYKYAIGWIDPSKTYIASADQKQNVFIKYLTDSKSHGYSMALVPIDGSNTEAYSIESRKPVGYDKNEIPGQGVLIHKIDLGGGFGPGGKVALVVDKTFDFNPNDAGAVWKPGEAYRDNPNNISIKVLKETKTGFWVSINQP
jgi:hypothetical protein